MTCLGPQQPDYSCPGWIALRDRIVTRDGHVCRNCGSHDALHVHHWLPLPPFREEVDGRGYGRGNCPLIVPESGLVTLCKDCHDSLTERRTQNAVLKNPALKALNRDPPKAEHNVFQLWALNGEVLPFRVRKETWNPKVDQHYLVERIEISKWPYGFAWGRFVRNGEAGDLGKIASPGTYTWFLVRDEAE